MGNTLVTPQAQVYSVDHYLAELPEIAYDSNLGSTCFMKVARAKHEKEGLVVVKVFPIHDLTLPIKREQQKIEEIKMLLAKVPNCLPFKKTLVFEKVAFLVRQYIQHNLYDRISTRPFLNNIEKQWIAFQMLYALSQCHKLGVCHGDIKLENVLVTGWNWVVLTDFASFKPTTLEENNPAIYNYFFDTSRRRTCYIAPERFIKSSYHDSTTIAAALTAAIPTIVLPEEIREKEKELVPSMDIFSLGCALIELFTEGNAPFDFQHLLSYSTSDCDDASLTKVLDKIEDKNIKELVTHMIQKDPSKRLSAEEYLDQQRGKAFPEYFYSFLKDYLMGFAVTPDLSPDDKVERIHKDIEKIIKGCSESEGLVIVVSLVTSCLRSLQHCSAKLHALEVLRELAPLLAPDIILDRILPYLMKMVTDTHPRVKVAVVKILSYTLTLVETIPRSDANIFPEYILRYLATLCQDEAVSVKVAYAETIASIAESAIRFLEKSQLHLIAENGDPIDSSPPFCKETYDRELRTIHDMIQQSVSTLLSDQDNIVKRTLLENGIIRLCNFFGPQKANDVLLSHMITFLNDKEDRHLRKAFFENIAGVASYVGFQCCPILKPLLQQGLSDPEEFVICKALQALSELSSYGLLQKQIIYDLLPETASLLCHPNLWIRQGTVGFIHQVASSMNIADVNCKLVPHLQKFINLSLGFVNKPELLLKELKPPLTRAIFNTLINMPNLRDLLHYIQNRQVERLIHSLGPSVPPYKADKEPPSNATIQVYKRLLSDGLNDEWEDLILAMKDYLLKINENKQRLQDNKKNNGIIDLGSHKNIHRRLFDVTFSYNDPSADSASNVHRRHAKKKNVNPDSQVAHMNEDWQNLFGTGADSQLHPPPSSPKMPRQSSSDSLAGGTGGGESTGGESSQPPPPTPPPSQPATSPKPSPLQIITQPSDSAKTRSKYHCVPCQADLNALIKKKQEEFFREQYSSTTRIYAEDFLTPERHLTQGSSSPLWKPKGQLVAHIHEHRSAINRIQVLPNSPLFATCSNDGTIKIWDCTKIEGKGVSNRSRLTYTKMEGDIISMTACPALNALAAASETGDIHVFRVDGSSTSPCRTSIAHTRNLDLNEEGCVVDMLYYNSGCQNVLSYATVRGHLVGWDLRAPGDAWKLHHDLSKGIITSYIIDPCHCWMLAGTSTGKMVCWDLRFQLPITTLSYPIESPVNKVVLHPKRQSAAWASIKGNNEVTLWDVETGNKVLTLWGSPLPPFSRSQPQSHPSSVRAMVYMGDNSAQNKDEYLITGGSDVNIRIWDISNPEKSRIMVRSSLPDQPSMPDPYYESQIVDGDSVIREIVPSNPGGGAPSSPHSEEHPRRYPEPPHPGHFSPITDLALAHASQNFLVSASLDGTLKVWK